LVRHYFSQERLDHPHTLNVNGLACYTLRGDVRSVDVRLNSADGFEFATVCQCDFLFIVEKSKLHSCLGSVSWERQQAIKGKVKQVLRL
jgi:hypothetical protein